MSNCSCEWLPLALFDSWKPLYGSYYSLSASHSVYSLSPVLGYFLS
jgi:hypothetical protein